MCSLVPWHPRSTVFSSRCLVVTLRYFGKQYRAHRLDFRGGAWSAWGWLAPGRSTTQPSPVPSTVCSGNQDQGGFLADGSRGLGRGRAGSAPLSLDPPAEGALGPARSAQLCPLLRPPVLWRLCVRFCIMGTRISPSGCRRSRKTVAGPAPEGRLRPRSHPWRRTSPDVPGASVAYVEAAAEKQRAPSQASPQRERPLLVSSGAIPLGAPRLLICQIDTPNSRRSLWGLKE